MSDTGAPLAREPESADLRLALNDDTARAAVSPRADAALRVLLGLARTPAPGVQTAESLARSQGLTRRMLDPVLLDLSRAGIVIGLRGQFGGYRLGWQTEQITLADVIAAVDRPLAEACGLTGRANRVRPPTDGLEAMWLGVRAGLHAVLEGFTVDALVRDTTGTGADLAADSGADAGERAARGA
jgi:Rrf2 family protein